MSIQLQQNGSISNVTFSGTTHVNSLYGGRFKSYQGLSGNITDVGFVLCGPILQRNESVDIDLDHLGEFHNDQCHLSTFLGKLFKAVDG